MEKNEYSCPQSSLKLSSNELNKNNINHNASETSNNSVLKISIPHDVKSEKYIESFIESDQNSTCSNPQHYKDNAFYLSEGKSTPNFTECPLVPRSPSTNVQLDINDLKNRDQDVIYSNDKFPFNDSSSNVSYASITPIPLPTDSNNFMQIKDENQLNQNQKTSSTEKFATQTKQSQQNNQLHSPNPPPGRKIPKIPDIFYHSKQNGNNGYNKNDKFSYSWPKKKNQKSTHLAQSSQYSSTVSTSNKSKKKEISSLRKP